MILLLVFTSVGDSLLLPAMVFKNWIGFFFFFDEAWVHLNSYINSQTYRMWTSENPHTFTKKEPHSQKIGIWWATSFTPKNYRFFFLFYRNSNCWMISHNDEIIHCRLGRNRTILLVATRWCYGTHGNQNGFFEDLL